MWMPGRRTSAAFRMADRAAMALRNDEFGAGPPSGYQGAVADGLPSTDLEQPYRRCAK
jgi:hypothetical protein